MNFSIGETATFQKRIALPEFRRYYPKIRTYVYPILRSNPFFGPNIKRLKGEYSKYYRFRIGDHRLFYTVTADINTVFILDIEHRGDAYR